MHIPNALLDPQVAIATGVIGAAGLAYGLRSLERSLGEATTVKMGIMAAFVFAAQMVNFPLGVLPASGHLLGGVLAAVMLGPWGGTVVIAAVLIVQCLLSGDGGLTALGANFINMGLIGAGVGSLIYTPIRRLIGGRTGVLVGAMIAAWLSVILAAGAFSIELAASRRSHDFFQVLSLMTMVHAVIGVGEALITGMVVRFILRTRPDLIEGVEADESDGGHASRRGGWVRLGAAGLACALAVGIFLAPFASSYEDGLEYVGGESNLRFTPSAERSAPTVPPPLPNYQFPGLDRFSLKMATATSGAIGTLVVFGFAIALASGLNSLKPHAPDVNPVLAKAGGLGDEAR